MKTRKPNFIDKIRPDLKSHVILGLILNPIIYNLTILSSNWFGWFQGNPIIASRYALLFCLLAHLTIEVSQFVKKTGKFQFSDALAGWSTALIFAQPIIELINYYYIEV